MEKKLIQELKDKMKAKRMSVLKLSKLTGIANSTLDDNLKFRTKMFLSTYCKVLEVVA